MFGVVTPLAAALGAWLFIRSGVLAKREIIDAEVIVDAQASSTSQTKNPFSEEGP
jgi:hypothetical protein